MVANRILWAVLPLLLLVACSGGGKSDRFVLKGELVNSRSAERAYLYRFMREYGRVEVIDSADIHNGRFSIGGVCDVPSEAFVVFDKEKESYGFILSAAELDMKVGRNSYAVTGTPDNNLLSRLMSKHHAGVNERNRLQKEYLALAADSALTKSAEDSLLALYRSYPAELRREVFNAVDGNVRKNPLLADLIFRTMSFALSAEQADSLASRLNLRN